jgi:elongation factor Ts
MSAEASIAYSLSRDTGFCAELCKLALERSKNDTSSARRMLDRWDNSKTNATNISEPNEEIKSFGVVCSYFESEACAAAVLEAKCTDELFAKSKEFYELVGEATEEIARYEEPYCVNARLPELEEKHKCKINFNSARIQKTNTFSLLTTYTHRDSIGVIVETEVDNEEAFKNKQFRLFSFDCALHIAAFDPVAVRPEEVPGELKHNIERQIEKQLMRDGKSMQYWQIAIEGKLKKWAEQRTLLAQTFIKSEKETVEDIRKKISDIVGSNVRVKRFVRFALG